MKKAALKKKKGVSVVYLCFLKSVVAATTLHSQTLSPARKLVL